MQDDGINVNIVHQLQAATIINSVLEYVSQEPPCTPIKKGATDVICNPLIFLVGMARFERAASASRTLRSSQAEPHPVEKGNISETLNFGKPFFICKKIRADVL